MPLSDFHFPKFWPGFHYVLADFIFADLQKIVFAHRPDNPDKNPPKIFLFFLSFFSLFPPPPSYQDYFHTTARASFSAFFSFPSLFSMNRTSPAFSGAKKIRKRNKNIWKSASKKLFFLLFSSSFSPFFLYYKQSEIHWLSARLPDWAMPRGKNRCQLHLLFLSGCYRPAFICFGATFSQWMMLLFFLCSWLFLCIFRAFGIRQHLLRAISCLKTLQAVTVSGCIFFSGLPARAV